MYAPYRFFSLSPDSLPAPRPDADLYREVPRVAMRTGWLPQLDLRAPERPESLRARLFRQSRALTGVEDPRTQTEYQYLMGAFNASPAPRLFSVER